MSVLAVNGTPKKREKDRIVRKAVKKPRTESKRLKNGLFQLQQSIVIYLCTNHC